LLHGGESLMDLSELQRRHAPNLDQSWPKIKPAFFGPAGSNQRTFE
jgi:hypothetical protein